MPCQLTHMYLAGCLALQYSANHESDVIRDIHNGFASWIDYNNKLKTDMNDALGQKQPEAVISVIRDYFDRIIANDAIAVFSAFATGTVGPDLWTVLGTHETTSTLLGRLRREPKVDAAHSFDLGHYNLSHAFPTVVLKRIKGSVSELDQLQKKYQTAYILGYLSHIALDITGHLKVNAFAGAYFQLEKDLWETEQFGTLEAMNLFNSHNKVEQYFDALIRFVCFEGYHSELSGYDYLREEILGQSKLWNFPNYTDYWKNEAKKKGKDSTLLNQVSKFVDMSTSLPGAFVYRYTISSEKKVRPFIKKDFCEAYKNCTAFSKKDESSLNKLKSEMLKLKYFDFNNYGEPNSQYYYLKTVIPDLDKIKSFGTDFYDPSAFAKFVMAGKIVSTVFIDAALDYLKNGDGKIFGLIHNWNLDTGLAIRIKNGCSVESDFPLKPYRPATIDLVNVFESFPELDTWKPPKLDPEKLKVHKKRTKWNVPDLGRQHGATHVNAFNSSGRKSEIVLMGVSGIDIRISGLKLFSDNDEMGFLLFGNNSYELTPSTAILSSEHTYKMGVTGKHQSCLENFKVNDDFVTMKTKQGNSNIVEARATFFSTIPKVQKCTPAINDFSSVQETGCLEIPSYATNILPRHMRVSACRKYVCRPSDSGNFNPKAYHVCETIYPTEELCLAVYGLIKRENEFMDLFHNACVFSEDEVNELKSIRKIGVNVILLMFSEVLDGNTSALNLVEAFVDGEKQHLC